MGHALGQIEDSLFCESYRVLSVEEHRGVYKAL